MDPFNVIDSIDTAAGKFKFYSLAKLAAAGVGPIDQLPISIRVLLEAQLRNYDNFVVTEQHIRDLANWDPSNPNEFPHKPARVLLQDFTGVPAVVDLAALRDGCKALGGNVEDINPLVQCDLVIDHSVQVDSYARPDSLQRNLDIEFERNIERYEFLKWGQGAFANFRCVPPGTGIVHQVNLEYLAPVVITRDGVAYPDSCVGTDSHTTMINGLGVLGWGVGGIEAEAVMLGQPVFMLPPPVVGFKLTGRMREGTTATDLVLTCTEILRAKDVVEQFVEFFGEGAASLSLPDRATIANMAPEYGATMGFFPVDDVSLDYLRQTGRDAKHIDLVEKYCKAQGLWRSAEAEARIKFTRVFELDLNTVEPCLAGPKRPQDRILLSHMRAQWDKDLVKGFGKKESDPAVKVSMDGKDFELKHGHVVIAAITSCTNTSNPDVLVAAGLLARAAVQHGLTVPPWVKTSLAPGSRVVTDYLQAAGLDHDLARIGFDTVGYGCTTCIGNSGPLPQAISDAITAGDLVAASVLSGNRNFEGRVNPDCRANYLASPPLVVAYALAGTVVIDLTTEPLGHSPSGTPVYLRDLWPSTAQIRSTVAAALSPSHFASRYASLAGPPQWQAIAAAPTPMYSWPPASTYIRSPPYFHDLPRSPSPIAALRGCRCLLTLKDSVTTDHISPAGAIPKGPAARYLVERGVPRAEFNTFGARRGNHEVMVRGTFANIRVRNGLVEGTEGGVTEYLPTGEQMYVFEAAERYRLEGGIPLLVLAGKDYGMGSSRDMAVKGPMLLGVRVVVAESFERIHRSNLVGMGILPLVYRQGETKESLKLTGREEFSFEIDDTLKPKQDVKVAAKDLKTGKVTEFVTRCRIDTPIEVEYYRHGGILQYVLRRIALKK